jgi:hypothetical protein
VVESESRGSVSATTKDVAEYTKGRTTFHQSNIHPNFSWNTSHVYGTHASPFWHAFAYSQCAAKSNKEADETYG